MWLEFWFPALVAELGAALARCLSADWACVDLTIGVSVNGDVALVAPSALFVTPISGDDAELLMILLLLFKSSVKFDKPSNCLPRSSTLVILKSSLCLDVNID